MSSKGYSKVDAHEIVKFLVQAGIDAKSISIFTEAGIPALEAKRNGDAVIIADGDGNAHLNCTLNLREALLEAGWDGFVGAIFRVGARQHVTGQLHWGPHLTTQQFESPVRLPKHLRPAEEAAAPLAEVVPLVPQQ